MADNGCRNCANCGWVCENHPDRPWGGLSANPYACECGAGAPCGVCNLKMASAGYVERERDNIIAFLKAQPESYSGWNPHDEQYDDGANGMMRWVIGALERREDRAAIVDQSPEGRDAQRLDAQHAGAVPQAIAQTPESETNNAHN